MEGSLVAYKVFTNGSVLNASEVNDNLMNQAVITFTNSTARASAITSPVEGMVTYLADTDTYQFWNGSAWTNLVSGGGGTQNAIINGGFDIWQRGSSFTPAAGGVQTYTADRFLTQRDGTGATVTVSRQTFTPGSAPVAGYEAEFYLRFAQSVAGSGSTYNLLAQKVEDVRAFAGQSATLSFWAKADATRVIQPLTVQGFGSGGSGDVVTNGTNITLTTGWVRYTQTLTIPSVSGKTIGTGSSLTVALNLPLNTTQTIDIWGVQLEAGSTATAFRRNANSLEGELAACQRYYYRATPNSTSGILSEMGWCYSTTTGDIVLKHPVTMRAIPTSIDFSLVSFLVSGTSVNAVSAIVFDGPAEDRSRLVGTSTGLTSNRAAFFRQTSAGGFLGVSAEL
jgi:hypothetical protein